MQRSNTNDYLRESDIVALRRDLDGVLNEIFPRDEGTRGGFLRSFDSLGSSGGGLGDRELQERVTKYNLVITLSNNRVTTQMHYADVYPKYNRYGEQPRDFQRPRRMDDLLNLDATTVDHILSSYDLPSDLPNLRRYDMSRPTRDDLRVGLLARGMNDRERYNRDQKLLVLFEYLGVDISKEREGGVSALNYGKFGGGLGAGGIGGGGMGIGLGGGMGRLGGGVERLLG